MNYFEMFFEPSDVVTLPFSNLFFLYISKLFNILKSKWLNASKINLQTEIILNEHVRPFKNRIQVAEILA